MPVSSQSFRLQVSGFHQFALAAIALTLPCAAAQAQYTTIDPPGSTYNIALGVSNGVVVGYQNYGATGFTFDGTSYTTFNVPGALSTQFDGISGSNLFGNYVDSGGNGHGFVYNGSSVATIPDFPGSTPYSTVVDTGQGNVVGGGYTDSLGNLHGYAYDTTSQLFTAIDDPNTSGDPNGNTTVTGINGAAAVGTYGLTSGNYGFMESHGVYTTVSDPLGIGLTTVNGGLGAYVVGQYVDGSNVYHGFLYNSYNNSYTTLDDPAAGSHLGTNVYGIGYNPSGGITVVGAYWDSGNIAHPFEMTYTPEPGTTGLLVGIGLSGVGIAFRRRRKR